MVRISDGLYCRKMIFDLAKSTAKTSAQMVRKLVPGIFSKEAQISCTLSGQAVRSLGRERQQEITKNLNIDAVQAIQSKIYKAFF